MMLDRTWQRGAWPLVWAFPLVLVVSACGRSAQTPVPVVTPAELGPSAQRSELCSAANIVGVGLRGEYFAQPHWKGQPLLTRVDPSVDFIASLELPTELAGKLPQSIRWSGWVKAPTSGKYRFHMQPEQARVTVSRVDVQSASKDGIEMVAGRFYPITVEIDELAPGTLPVRLEWTAPHGARYVIPRAVLNLPTETVAEPRGG